MDWSNITSLASLFVGGAAIITALVAIVTTVVTRNNVTRQLETQYKTHTEMLQHQRVLETDKDRRSLRDAKLARLREHYRVVLQSAELMSSLLRQERDISGISDPAYRAERLAEAQQQWGMLSPQLNISHTSVALESDSQPVEDLTEQFVVLSLGYGEPQNSLHPKSRDAIVADIVTMKALTTCLHEEMRAHLRRIEAAN